MRFNTAIPAALAVLMTGCGGGGGGGGSGPIVGAPPPPPPAPAENVATITVARGTQGVLNIPTVSVAVCSPGDSSRCHVIDNVLLDTGSVGLRVVGSALAAAGPGVTLPAEEDPLGNTLYECVTFLDGSHAWGAVRRADVRIGGKTAANIPIQLIGDGPANGARPSLCANADAGFDLGVAGNLGANGILGVKYWIQDCGSLCVDKDSIAQGFPYYTCSANSCSPADAPLRSQVRNPVSAFVGDNNGVIVDLPAVPAQGSPSVTGSLIFGINTRSNNGLGGARLFNGESLLTHYKGTTFDAIIDSGSNALYFDDASIARCNDSIFFCPASTLDLTAVVDDGTGNTRTVAFSVASLAGLPRSNFAFNNVAGYFVFGDMDDDLQPEWVYFDWGLPFFFGKKVYFGLEGGPYPYAVGF